jgi:predicted dehydrogenase
MVEAIKLGLIGAGTVADYGHLPAIAASPAAELVIVADISRQNLRRAREKLGVRGTLDYHKLLAMEQIEAVSICTPVDTHRQIAEDALAAGKHVFCEKPLAATEADCDAIVKAAGDSDRVFAVDFHLRLSEDMLASKKHIDVGDIGDLEVLRFVMNWGCHGTQGGAGRRRASFMKTGGPMLDNGVHFFDLARWLSGAEIESMTAQGQWVEEEFEYPGHVISTSRLSSGVLALIEMSFVYGHTTRDLPASSRMEIIGSRGVIADGRVYTPEGHTPLPRGGKKRFDRIYAEFLRCVQEGTMSGSTLAGAVDGARATQASLKAIALAMESRPLGGKS